MANPGALVPIFRGSVGEDPVEWMERYTLWLNTQNLRNGEIAKISHCALLFKDHALYWYKTLDVRPATSRWGGLIW